MVAFFLRSPVETLQFLATQIFTVFTQDADLARRMSKEEVAPVLLTIFQELSLPLRMRVFAIQTLGNLVSIDPVVADILFKNNGM